MEVHLSPENQAQLNEYAVRHGQNPSDALQEVIAAAQEWDLQDYDQAVAGIRAGVADLAAGRVRSVETSFAQLREKHALPR